jgi:hypothetical protein
MTEESPPLVPSTETKSSSWNFDQLNEEDESSENCNDFFSVLKKSIAKNVYLDDEIHHDETNFSKKNNERSTVRVDSSDLISRCKHFLPLLTDANQNLFSKIKSGENVRIELDSDEDNERTIEMNLMFCPNIDSSSSSDSEDEQTEPTLIPVNKKSHSVNIVEIEKLEENVNN